MPTTLRNTFEKQTVIQNIYSHKEPQTCTLSGSEYLFTICDGTVLMMNDACEVVKQFMGNAQSITCFSVCSINELLYVVDRSNMMLIYALDDDESALHEVKIGSKCPISISLDSTGRFAAVGSSDNTIRVFDVSLRHMTHLFRCGRVPEIISFIPGELQFLVAAQSDPVIKVYDLHEKKQVGSLRNHLSSIAYMRFLFDGKFLLSTGSDNVICLFDVKERRFLTEFTAMETIHTILVLEEICDSPIANSDVIARVLVAGESNNVRIVDVTLDRFKVKSEYKLPITNSSRKNYASDYIRHGVLLNGRAMLFSTLTHISVLSETFDAIDFSILGYCDTVISTGFLPWKKEEMVVVTNDAFVVHRRLGSMMGQLLFAHTEPVLSACISARSKHMVTVSRDKSSVLWEYEDGSFVPLVRLTGHTSSVTGASIFSYSEIEMAVYTVSADRTLKRFDINTHNINGDAKATWTQIIHETDINSIDISPNGNLIATGSQDKTIAIHTCDGEFVDRLRGHKRGVWNVHFSHKTKLLASCSSDGTVRLWSMENYELMKTLKLVESGAVLDVCLISNDMQIAAVYSTGVVAVINIKTSEMAFGTDAHDGSRVWTIKSYDDGDHLLTGGSDGSVIFWHDKTEEAIRLEEEDKQAKLELQQKLWNFIKAKRYVEAAHICLELNFSKRLLTVIGMMNDKSLHQFLFETAKKDIPNILLLQERNSRNEEKEELEVLETNSRNLGMETTDMGTILDVKRDEKKVISLMLRLFKFCRDWMCHSRTYTEAVRIITKQLEIHALDRFSELLSLDMSNSKFIILTVQSYLQKHINRLHRMLHTAYILKQYTGMDSFEEEEDGEKPRIVAVENALNDIKNSL
ncbi:hypothetical protein PCE1_002040 [Barthelona sp. PCE]